MSDIQNVSLLFKLLTHYWTPSSLRTPTHSQTVSAVGIMIFNFIEIGSFIFILTRLKYQGLFPGQVNVDIEVGVIELLGQRDSLQQRHWHWDSTYILSPVLLLSCLMSLTDQDHPGHCDIFFHGAEPE